MKKKPEYVCSKCGTPCEFNVLASGVDGVSVYCGNCSDMFEFGFLSGKKAAREKILDSLGIWTNAQGIVLGGGK